MRFIFLTVPAWIPANFTLLPDTSPWMFSNLAFKTKFDPNKFLFLPIMYKSITRNKSPASTNTPNFTLLIIFFAIIIIQKILSLSDLRFYSVLHNCPSHNSFHRSGSPPCHLLFAHTSYHGKLLTTKCCTYR